MAASGWFKSNYTAISQGYLQKCPFYDVLIIFSSQHVLDTCLMYKKSNSFVYKFVNCQPFLDICLYAFKPAAVNSREHNVFSAHKNIQ